MPGKVEIISFCREGWGQGVEKDRGGEGQGGEGWGSLIEIVGTVGHARECRDA
jgi:hypothetical protein